MTRSVNFAGLAYIANQDWLRLGVKFMRIEDMEMEESLKPSSAQSCLLGIKSSETPH